MARRSTITIDTLADGITGEDLAADLEAQAPKPKRTRKTKSEPLVPEVLDLIDSEYIPDDEVVQIDAKSGYRMIHGYDQSGQLLEIGRVRYRDFESGQGAVRAMVLESGYSGKEHSLGTASRKFVIPSHAQVLRPFLQAGLEPRKMVYNESGTEMVATLVNPSMVYEDLIHWDRAWLKENGQGLNVDGTTMELAVRVRNNLRFGKGISVETGFFRLVCVNGLVSKVLNMGSWWSNHANFSTAKITEFAHQISGSPSELPTAPTELLDDVLEVLDRIDQEALALPRLMRKPAQLVSGLMRGERGTALKENLAALRDGKDTMTTLDLVNCQTNTAHRARSAWGVYDVTDGVTRSLVDLVDLAGVKHNVPTFEVN
jgi:hypothetical protein